MKFNMPVTPPEDSAEVAYYKRLCEDSAVELQAVLDLRVGQMDSTSKINDLLRERRNRISSVIDRLRAKPAIET